MKQKKITLKYLEGFMKVLDANKNIGEADRNVVNYFMTIFGTIMRNTLK